MRIAIMRKDGSTRIIHSIMDRKDRVIVADRTIPRGSNAPSPIAPSKEESFNQQ